MTKELWLRCHEELIEELMEAQPELTWSQAYEMTADLASARVADKLAAMADQAKDDAKYKK